MPRGCARAAETQQGPIGVVDHAPLMQFACALECTVAQSPPSQTFASHVFVYAQLPVEPPSSAHAAPFVGCADGHPRESTPPGAGQSFTACHVPAVHSVVRERTSPSGHVTAYVHVVPASTAHVEPGCGSSQHAEVHVPESGRDVVTASGVESGDFDEHATALVTPARRIVTTSAALFICRPPG
jgi:hypothetical protein